MPKTSKKTKHQPGDIISIPVYDANGVLEPKEFKVEVGSMIYEILMRRNKGKLPKKMTK